MQGRFNDCQALCGRKLYEFFKNIVSRPIGSASFPNLRLNRWALLPHLIFSLGYLLIQQFPRPVIVFQAWFYDRFNHYFNGILLIVPHAGEGGFRSLHRTPHQRLVGHLLIKNSDEQARVGFEFYLHVQSNLGAVEVSRNGHQYSIHRSARLLEPAYTMPQVFSLSFHHL